MVAAVPSVLLGESDVSEGQAVLSASGICSMHAKGAILCTHTISYLVGCSKLTEADL